MSSEITVQVADLDNFRTTLGAVMQYLQAEDIAQSQRKLQTQVDYSQLTLEVVKVVQRVENIMKDYLLGQHDEEEVVDEYNALD